MNKLYAALIALFCLLAAALLPLFMSEYYMHIVVLVLLFAYLGQCWNILSGYTGQFSFGHAAFFGTGAYTSSILIVKFGISPWIGMVAGFALAFIIGAFIGLLSFRYKLKGAYFALATLAFAEILRIIVQNSAFFHKTLGVLIPLNVDPWMFQFASTAGYYYVILVLLVLLTLLVYKISRSRFGFRLIAIRENEDAARSLGINTFRSKMLALSLSAGFTAIGGTFYAQYLLFVEPPAVFSSAISIEVLFPAIIGGAGTVLGPIIGSIIITPLGEITQAVLGHYDGVHLIIYGIVLIVVILYLPEGISVWIHQLFRRWREKRKRKKLQSTNI